VDLVGRTVREDAERGNCSFVAGGPEINSVQSRVRSRCRMIPRLGFRWLPERSSVLDDSRNLGNDFGWAGRSDERLQFRFPTLRGQRHGSRLHTVCRFSRARRRICRQKLWPPGRCSKLLTLTSPQFHLGTLYLV
jgi:hypothetical protein